MSDKSVTTCTTILLAFFQKQKQKTYNNGCTCHCHTYKNKNKSTIQLTEMNDNKFFNCKCNQQCSINKSNKYKKYKKRKRKFNYCTTSGGKMLIEHTGSMSSIASPYKPIITPDRSRDRLRNTLTFCTSYGKERTISIKNPLNDQRLENFNGSPFCRRTPNDEGGKNDTSNHLRPKSYYEWTIPYEKIELGEIQATSPKGPVYRGRWHGDVMFYTRSHETAEEINDFHEEVALLGLIRHENVVLFMGACIQPPNLAVVTSVRKGHTLHEHLHLRKTTFHFGSKFSIAKQIAQGMGYLHAKGIILGKLCSRNIFLESKVKIGITDYTMASEPIVKSGYGFIPKGHLTYISPELMRSISIQNSYLLPSNKATQKSDIFAYGTMVYEIFFARYPFKDLNPYIVILKMGKGTVPSLEETDFPASFKSLIQSCWSPRDVERPEFQEILSNMKKFNIPRSLQKKLSLSDSGAINRNHVLNSPFHRLNASPAQHTRWKKQ